MKTIEIIAEYLTDYFLMVLQLLEHCAGFPRVGYILNTTPITSIKNAIALFDTCMRSAIERIMNCSLSRNERYEISLPRLKGGLNLPIAGELANAAYLGSLANTLSLRNSVHRRNENHVSQEFTDAVERFNMKNDLEITPQLILAYLKPQRSLSHFIHVKIRSIVFDAADTPNKARLNSLSNQFSSAWTSIINNQNECPELNAAQIRLLLQFRLGKNLFAREVDCLVCTGRMSDRKGHHEIVCAGLNRTKGRHDRVRVELFKIAGRAGLLPAREPANMLTQLDGSDDKPADVLIPDYQNGKGCCFDIVVSSPFTHVQKSADEPGSHMKAAEKRKCDLYQQMQPSQPRFFTIRNRRFRRNGSLLSCTR